MPVYFKNHQGCGLTKALLYLKKNCFYGDSSNGDNSAHFESHLEGCCPCLYLGVFVFISTQEVTEVVLERTPGQLQHEVLAILSVLE